MEKKNIADPVHKWPNIIELMIGCSMVQVGHHVFTCLYANDEFKIKQHNLGDTQCRSPIIKSPSPQEVNYIGK